MSKPRTGDLAPQPMTPAEVADLVLRARANERIAAAKGGRAKAAAVIKARIRRRLEKERP